MNPATPKKVTDNDWRESHVADDPLAFRQRV